MKNFLVFAFLLKGICSSGTSITIGETPEVFSFFKPNIYVSHYYNLNNLNPNELFKALDEHKFQLLAQNIYNSGSTDYYHYLSVDIVNTKSNTELIYWVIKNSAINRIQLYSRTNTEIKTYEEFGDYYQFDKRPDDFFLLSAPLIIEQNAKTTFILKLDKRKENLFIAFNTICGF